MPLPPLPPPPLPLPEAVVGVDAMVCGNCTGVPGVTAPLPAGAETRLTVALEAAAAAALAAKRPLTCSLMLEGAARVTVTPSVEDRARLASGGL